VRSPGSGGLSSNRHRWQIRYKGYAARGAKAVKRDVRARALFFNRLGELRDRSFENQVYRASGLNLLVAAIILWTTCYLDVALSRLAASPELVKHVAPLGWEHISLTGDYIWNRADQPASGELRPLRQTTSLLAA
jgi:hypothetical protein